MRDAAMRDNGPSRLGFNVGAPPLRSRVYRVEGNATSGTV